MPRITISSAWNIYEERNNSVPLIFVNSSFIFKNDVTHGGQVIVKQVYQFFGGQGFGNAREAFNIGKQRRRGE